MLSGARPPPDDPVTSLRAPIDRYFRPLLWSLIIGMVLYAAAIVITQPQAILGALRGLDPRLLLLIAGLLAVNYGLRFVRWQYYLAVSGYRVPHGRSLACYLGAFAFTTTPGKAGEAVRSVYLKRDGVRYVDSLAALFTERLLDVLALVILAMFIVLAFAAVTWTIAATSGLLLVTILVIRSPALQANAQARLERGPGGFVSRVGIHFIALLRSAERLFRLPRLAIGLGLGVVAWLAEGVIFYLILTSMDVAIAPTLAVGLWSVSMLVGAVSFLPGGLGATEATMGSLLLLVGVDGATAVAATLTYRVCTLWVAVALGLVIITRLELTDLGKYPAETAARRD